MKTCLYNGQIRPLTTEDALFDAILIEDGRILSLGHGKDLVPVADQAYNLEGKTLLPGFNDSHMHLLGFGAALKALQLEGVQSISQLRDKVTEALVTLAPGQWLTGRGWNQDYFDQPVLPTIKDLDDITGKTPTVLRRACGHILVCNSAAMAAAGITNQTLTPSGGTIDRFEDGSLSGIFRENAMDLVLGAIPDPSLTEMQSAIEAGCDYLLEHGVTSCQSDDLCVYPLEMTASILKAFTDMADQGRLKVRVNEQALYRTHENFLAGITAGWKTGKGDAWFKMGPLKILGDGSLGARTAWLTQPYADDPSTTGISMYTDDQIKQLARTAGENGFSLAIHGIGDAMIDQALTAIEVAQSAQGDQDLRHSIVHCQITRPDQLDRMKSMKVLAHIQPIFLHYDLHMATDRLGPERVASTYAFGTMKQMGIPIAMGTDAPVERPDTIPNLHCAVTRRDLAGQPPGGWLPQEALSMFDALRAMTIDGAWASGEEDLKGLLTPGHFADFVVLSHDPLTQPLDQVLDIQVLETWVDGKQAYKKAY